MVPIVFPEYTTVTAFEPIASCDALSGTLAEVVLPPVGSNVWVDSKVDPSMKFTVPLGAPPPAGLAMTVAVSMKPKSKLAILILALDCLACLLIWRSTPMPKITLSLTLAWCATAAVSAAVLGIMCQLRQRLILVGDVSAALVANTANIVYELSLDPTSHNLFPLELAMTAVINLFGAVMGIVVAVAFRRTAA